MVSRKHLSPNNVSIRAREQRSLRARCCCLLLGVFVSICFLIPGAFAQSQADELPGLADLKKGAYETAIKLFSARLATNPDAEAEKHLLLAYREIGRYREAETSAKKFLLKTPNAAAVRHQLAEVFATTGRYTEAISEFERAGADATKSSAEKLESDLRRAEVLQLTGQEDRARQIFESLVAHYKDSLPESGAELKVVARALVHLEKFQDANDLYQAAIEADPSNLESNLGAGELFIQKYNYGDAAQFIEEALQLNQNSARAHLAVALVKRFEGGEEMSAALDRALRINPNLVEALTFRAGLALEASEYGEATADIERAFKINPRSLDAHAIRAAMLYLQDRDFEPEVAAALRINPRYGTVFNVLSHFATMTRRTAQAASFARRAIEISPRLWSAHLNLGMALLRLGQMEAGREEVEKAFKGDPFNVWAKNTLDLLDSMKDYRETKNDQFVIKVDAKESDVISGYATELLREAATKLTAKYHFTPQGPIMVELFPNHEDFAVRTLGLPGLGALGVCFGQVIAADSPSARATTGEFNWGSTLWHEYTHVITLQITDYRIPRWFSEGLSVYEERRARPGWGDDWNPMLLRAFGAGRWFKIADLDAGFQRPRGPEDLPIAYFQASQVCEFIVDRFGFDAILRMLALYRDKVQTADILRQVLKLSESEFDRAFKEYIETKTRPLQEALKTEFNLAASLSKADVLKMLTVQDTFALHLRAGHLFAAGGDNQNAILHFKRAIELFPYYADEGNPYEPLAEILEKQGDKAQAADTLTALVKFDANNLVALRNVARLRLALGDRTRALEAMRLSFYVNPFEYATHTQAGELSLDTKQYAQALAEFQITLALDPPNVAEANYNVANAYHMLGRPPEARRAVLRALEAAPSYEKAQELLLKITGQ